MKTLHVMGSRLFGGAENCYVQLSNRLSADGHETVAINRPNSKVATLLAPSIRQHQVPMLNKWDAYSVLATRRILRAEQPPIVQTYMGRATRLTRVPMSMPSVHIARLGGFYKIDGYYRHADIWIGITHKLCDYLRASNLPSRRIFRIPNFVPPPSKATAAELAALRSSLALPDDALVLVALGRFVEKKGFSDLLRALAFLPLHIGGRQPMLLLGGDGPLQGALQAQCRQLGLSARVRFLGWLDRPDPYVQLADLVVFPSRHEPMGRILQEAWNHAKPVVCTRSEGPLEIATDELNVLFCPIADPQALADRLRTALEAPAADLQRLAEAGKATLEQHYTEAAVVQSYVELYQEALTLGRVR